MKSPLKINNQASLGLTWPAVTDEVIRMGKGIIPRGQGKHNHPSSVLQGDFEVQEARKTQGEEGTPGSNLFLTCLPIVCMANERREGDRRKEEGGGEGKERKGGKGDVG